MHSKAPACSASVPPSAATPAHPFLAARQPLHLSLALCGSPASIFSLSPYHLLTTASSGMYTSGTAACAPVRGGAPDGHVRQGVTCRPVHSPTTIAWEGLKQHALRMRRGQRSSGHGGRACRSRLWLGGRRCAGHLAGDDAGRRGLACAWRPSEMQGRGRGRDGLVANALVALRAAEQLCKGALTCWKRRHFQR